MHADSVKSAFYNDITETASKVLGKQQQTNTFQILPEISNEILVTFGRQIFKTRWSNVI